MTNEKSDRLQTVTAPNGGRMQPRGERVDGGSHDADPDLPGPILGRLPRLPNRLVDRPRLLDRLDACGPLTLLRAPLGFGKTTLVAQWVQYRRRPDELTAWITARDERDGAKALWLDVLTTLADPVVSLAEAHRTHHLHGRAERAIAAIDRPLLIVIDSFERLDDGIDRQFLNLLRGQSNLRLIICLRGHRRFARHDRVDVDTAVITADDLRLTTEEAAGLLSVFALAASPEDTEVIRAETGGWPEVTRAVTLGLQDAPAADLKSAVVAIATDHLRHRLLPEIPVDRLDLVLATSLPETFSAEVGHVLGDGEPAAAYLEQLAAEGMFHATIENGEPVYRWSPSARRALAGELARRSPDRLPVLHTRLSRWYLSRGLPEAALRHAAAAQDWTMVVKVIDAAWRRLFVEYHGSLLAALSRIPLDIIATSVRAIALRDLRLQAPDDRVLDVAALPAAPEELTRLGRSERAYDVLDTGIAVLVALRRRGLFDRARTYSDRLGAVAAAARPVRTTDVGSVLPPLQLVRGVTALLADDLPAAMETLRQAYESACESPSDYIEADAAAKLALVYALAGDTGPARRWLHRHQVAPVSHSWISRFTPVTVSTARVLIALDRLDLLDAAAAREPLTELSTNDESWAFVVYAEAQLALHSGSALDMLGRLDSARSGAGPWLGDGAIARPLLAAAEADLLTALGKGNQARAALRAAGAGHPLLRVAQARLTLLSGDPETAARLATDSTWARAAAPRAQLEMLLIHAIAAYRCSDVPTASNALQHAIHTARAVGNLRAFTTVPRAELGRLGTHLPGFADVLDDPLLTAATDVYPPAIVLVDLSKREQLVLDKLSKELSLRQTAEELYVSQNTIKTQLRSIYQKLNVESRQDAVARAREWGLLTTRVL